MREILFKAKTEMIVDIYNCGKEDGEWVQGYLRCDCGKWLIYQFETDRADQVAYEVNPDTICQYTGLTDKNGNKIWENDIVIYDNSPYNVYCTPHTGKISYRNGCLCFKYWLYGSINYMPFTADDFFGRKCEIIGNTIENPELLDNKTDCYRGNNMKNEELLPCPFCGSKAEIKENTEMGGGHYQVLCTNCPTTVGRYWYCKKKDVIKVWNTRITI